MAKKKGGKKGRKHQNRQQSEAPSIDETEVLDTAAATTQPEEITTRADEDSQSNISSTVSEVLGSDTQEKRKDSKFYKKFKTQLAKFTADGYDVSRLESMGETASTSELKGILDAFEEGIEKNKKIKDEMTQLNPTGIENELEELNRLLADPMQSEAASSKLIAVKNRCKTNEMMATLDSMVLSSLKPKVEEFKARLANTEDSSSLEIEYNELRKEYKETYAVEGVRAQIVSAEPGQKPEASKSRSPMMVKDIFLLYKDGRFISHHTNRVVSKEQQKELFADLKTGRNFLRSPKYAPQKLNIIPVDSRYILVQSGRFTVVIAITEGSVDPWSEKIVTKVLTLMEKEDQMELKAWNGDVASLKSSGKYMQALLFAFMKLANKGKQ
jgi:hypothetical protein